MTDFQRSILEGIPQELPQRTFTRSSSNPAPKRHPDLSSAQVRLAIKNALRYFPPTQHRVLAPEFLTELQQFGHIYMYRLKPSYQMYSRPIDEYPARSRAAAAIMLMIQNNLDPAVAQHPDELITYGGNGAVFQNWAQYRLVMKYLAEMSDTQTLVMYSGHPLGLFPSGAESPRVIVTNGMVVPNFSKPEDLERLYALGVTQYGQMTAGSYMYIGPQGIVHGTTLTILNATRMRRELVRAEDRRIPIFVSSGLGGMSGAQAKAGVIAGVVAVIAEVNRAVIEKRHQQGWVDEVIHDLPELERQIVAAARSGKAASFAYHGNIVDLWEYFADRGVIPDIGSDQTSLHNAFGGGYYPAGMKFEAAKEMLAADPEAFRKAVQESLKRQTRAINRLSERGMYFFDYGNAFLLEASRAGAEILNPDGEFRYPSYIQDIIGPLCFDFGFGPFRWVVTSGRDEDLHRTDNIAAHVLERLLESAPSEITQQLADNLQWIREAERNQLVVGSKARILYADAVGRVEIASAFNRAIANGEIQGTIVLGRDHHDVSGTDSPYRETSNIFDGSSVTADMAVHNFVGDAIRGATWVSLHNGGGVGWGEVINGGFGLVIDGSEESERRLRSMLSWDVQNGLARRAWARSAGARFAIGRAMSAESSLTVTQANDVDDVLLDTLLGSS